MWFQSRVAILWGGYIGGIVNIRPNGWFQSRVAILWGGYINLWIDSIYNARLFQSRVAILWGGYATTAARYGRQGVVSIAGGDSVGGLH